MIHLLTGLPGSGKTEVANIIQRETNATVINLDTLRNFFFPNGENTKNDDFTDKQLSFLYGLLPEIVFQFVKLSLDKPIIVDGVFRKEEQRTRVIAKVKETQIPVSVLLISASEDIIVQRLLIRQQLGVQNGSINTYRAVSRDFEFPQNAWIIDNSGSKFELEKEVKRYLVTVDLE